MKLSFQSLFKSKNGFTKKENVMSEPANDHECNATPLKQTM